MKHLRQIAFALTVAVILGAAPDASACAACFGKSNDRMFDSYFIGAMALIGLIVMVLATISAFFIYLARRAAKFNADVSLTPNSN
ncbi:MAG: hypothetical protein HY301_19790 [Verrucomicrobia bacterium]|nr:hypothetical protein [Verrucomicrobiota bacterium]